MWPRLSLPSERREIRREGKSWFMIIPAYVIVTMVVKHGSSYTENCFNLQVIRSHKDTLRIQILLIHEHGISFVFVSSIISFISNCNAHFGNLWFPWLYLFLNKFYTCNWWCSLDLSFGKLSFIQFLFKKLTFLYVDFIFCNLIGLFSLFLTAFGRDLRLFHV